jgi:methyl-accepting chemotaxis protein
MRSVTLQAFAWLIFCGLTLLLILALGSSLVDSNRKLGFAERSVNFDKAANALLVASEQLSVERGLTQSAILAQGPASAEAIAAISQPRARAIAKLDEALAAVAPLSFSNREALMTAVRQSATEIQQLRQQADAAMKQPRNERADALIQRWYPAATGGVQHMQALWQGIAYEASSQDAFIALMTETKYLAGALREYAGRERAALGAAVAGTAPFDQAKQRDAIDQQARIDFAWQRVQQLNAGAEAPAEIRTAIGAAKTAFFDTYAKVRSAVTAKVVAGEPAGLTPRDWSAASNPALQSFVDIRDAAISATNRHVTELSATATFNRNISIAELLAALAITATGLIVLTQRYLRPLKILTERTARLAAGDAGEEMPASKRDDEIGRMATALASFRDNALERDSLASRIAGDREAAEQRRAEQAAREAAAGSEISALVGKIAAGDLSGRIDETAKDGFFLTTSRELNRLTGMLHGMAQEMTDVIGAMAAGDLSRRVNGEYRGVFLDLKTNVNSTSDTLAATMRGILQATDAVRDASAEISNGSQDLAQRTESQAASIEETAASMHEVTTTVKQNADNAQAANQLAVAARDTAEKGGGVVSDAVGAVTRIEESAKKISDIVGLIDEIAFQTNLLALNASVEAARAGEAGKGFAVVAQEVRALAQRSANASKDIKSLIAESNAQVKTGASLVNQTGQSLTEIVNAIKKVSDIVAEIAAASREQATGLEQVNTAVGSMDEMTQRNGALVEETSASAQALAGQAKELTRLVAFFRVA